MLLLRIPTDEDDDDDDDCERQPPTLFGCLKSTAAMCKNKTMVLLLPSIFFRSVLPRTLLGHGGGGGAKKGEAKRGWREAGAKL